MVTELLPAGKDGQGTAETATLRLDGFDSQTLSMSQLPQLVDMLAAIRIDLTSHAKGSATDGERMTRALAQLDAAIAVAKRIVVGSSGGIVVGSSGESEGPKIGSENVRGRGPHL